MCPSLLQCQLPAPLSATPIIDTFVAGCCAVLFLIYTILFSIAPLPPSTVVIPPVTTFHPCIPLCPCCSLVWSSLIHPGWLLHRISSCRRLLFAGASTCCLAAASCCPSWLVVAPLPPPLFTPLPPIYRGLHIFLFVTSFSCQWFLCPLLLRLRASCTHWRMIFTSCRPLGKNWAIQLHGQVLPPCNCIAQIATWEQIQNNSWCHWMWIRGGGKLFNFWHDHKY